MGDLLKEAIADAKAVRETALQNAKMALEEAFTPQLKSMLSAKLKEDEFEDEEEFGGEDEFGDEEVPEEPEENYHYEDDEFGDEEGEKEFGDENPFAGGDEEVPEEEPEFEEEGVIEINGVKYAPVVSQDDVFESEENNISNLDLESVIKELESELSEGEDKEDEDEDKEEVEEQSDSSNIGSGDNALKAASGTDEDDPEKGQGDAV